MRPFSLLLPVVLALLGLLACSDGTGPADKPGISVVAGDAVHDSVLAPVGDLVVRVVAPDGRDASGAVITFEGAPVLNRNGISVLSVRIAPRDAGTFSGSVSTRTDSRGAAGVRVRLGAVAGTGHVLVSVPSLGLVDSVPYAIRPGNFLAWKATPGDTALTVGSSFTLRAGAFDGHGNVAVDELTVADVSGPVTMDGLSVRGDSVGRAIVRLRLVVRPTTVEVAESLTVVPPGRLAAAYVATLQGDSSGLDVFDTGGGHRSRIVRHAVAWPAWSRDGSRLAFIDNDYRLRLWSASSGIVQVADTSAHVDIGKSVQFDSAGTWIYFAAGLFSQDRIWRIHPDGTGAELVDTLGGELGLGQETPTVAPDGRIAYFSGPAAWSPQLTVADLATRQVTLLNRHGIRPRWSPTGEWIAYLDEYLYQLTLVRPDGSDAHPLDIAPVGAGWGHAWSPDGRWLVVAVKEGLFLVDAETARVLPLPRTRGYRQPTWTVP